jgi:hypothetical protein
MSAAAQQEGQHVAARIVRGKAYGREVIDRPGMHGTPRVDRRARAHESLRKVRRRVRGGVHERRQSARRPRIRIRAVLEQ